MQNYEVTGKPVTFGIGLELKLSESQAEARSASLKKKKKDIYEVIHPVQFKQGEKITVVTGDVPKALSENLKNSSDKKSEETIQYPCIKNASFGNFNVFDKDGNQITKKPVKKDEAEKIFSEISKTNQETFEEETENDEESDEENNDVNNSATNNQNNV